MPMMGELHIGTSGYQYPHWKGTFYPCELPQHAWFAQYADAFDSVEINNSFYRLPSAETFDAWHDEAPPGFRFALKFSRYGSHLKKLKDPESTIGLFLERAEHLKTYLGPILVQLPPGWGVDAKRLDAFLAAAPRRRRWAVEFRDPSWLCEEVYATLREHDAALCLHDLIEDHPWIATTDWIYVRFHGSGNGGSYSAQALSAAAKRIAALRREAEQAWIYFNNDAHGHAVHNAADLRRHLDAD